MLDTFVLVCYHNSMKGMTVRTLQAGRVHDAPKVVQVEGLGRVLIDERASGAVGPRALVDVYRIGHVTYYVAYTVG